MSRTNGVVGLLYLCRCWRFALDARSVGETKIEIACIQSLELGKLSVRKYYVSIRLKNIIHYLMARGGRMPLCAPLHVGFAAPPQQILWRIWYHLRAWN